MNKPHGNFPPQKTDSRFFYGYTIAILAFIIILVVYGLRFSYGVFFKPMSSELGWSNATTSLVYSISMLMEGLLNIFLGGVVDKYGPRLVVTLSGVLVALGYCLIPLVHSTWQFFVLYSGLIGIGMGGLFAPLVSIVTRWFSARRTLITGIVISSVGLGTLIVSPVANALIAQVDWRTTFLIFGIVILFVTVIPAQFLKRDPAALGLVAYGENVADARSREPAQGLSFRQAVHFHQYWFVFFLFLAYGFCTNSVGIHLVPNAIKLGITPGVAAAILAAIGGLQIVGRIGLGLAADRVGNRTIFIAGFLAAAALTLWLPSISLTWAFFAFSVIFGLAQGGLASSQSPLIANLFGLKSHGLLFGFCGFGFTVGAALGPYATGRVVDVSGSYHWAFLAASIFSLAGMFVAISLRPLSSFPLRKRPL
jgi:MFS family permease